MFLFQIVKIRTILTLIAFTLIFSSCSGELTPEDIVKEFIQSFETAAEEGHARSLRSYISDNYADENERKKADIDTVVTSYLLRNRNIHTFSKIISVTAVNNLSVSSSILVALSGKPINDVSFLPNLNADIYWFKITITQENNNWKLISVQWRQAMVDDFFKS